ncbi:transcriptional regulator [Candidatus Acetothermia bacterium]|nr:transcriptional regulator [Candidatus Acetothermia bacterium]MBI3643372.1 transcriptional regulator [Candidatus Acetothermia bacterium]
MEAVVKRQLQETRRKILEFLKLHGPLTADELGEKLCISSMGARQHLKALEHDDLIQHEMEQRGMGRPSYIYSLTTMGDELFPRAYPQMANSLLGALRALDGEEGIERLFKKRTENLLKEYQLRLDNKSLAECVQELAKIRTEEGYMAECEKIDDESFMLREHNCSICQIARECSQACMYELKLFKMALPQAKVTRQEHMIKGDRMCTYVIRKEKRK